MIGCPSVWIEMVKFVVAECYEFKAPCKLTIGVASAPCNFLLWVFIITNWVEGSASGNWCWHGETSHWSFGMTGLLASTSKTKSCKWDEDELD